MSGGLTLDGTQFDALTRELARVLSRRTVASLSVSIGAALLLPVGSVGKVHPHRYKKGKKGNKHKKHKRHNAPLVFNQFGCVEVGGRCQGNSANCCSGICQGKKPKHGERDKSVCVGHNVGACTPASSECLIGA